MTQPFKMQDGTNFFILSIDTTNKISLSLVVVADTLEDAKTAAEEYLDNDFPEEWFHEARIKETGVTILP